MFIRKDLQIADQILEVNWVPLLEIISEGVHEGEKYCS